MLISYFIPNLIPRVFFIHFDQPSQLCHIEATPVRFNFKLCLENELNQEVSILNYQVKFNKNTK